MGMRKYFSVVLLLAVLLLSTQADCWQSGEAEAVTVTTPFQPQYASNEHPQSSLNHIASLTGLHQFQQQYHTDGSGLTIAVIDSGVDMGHQAFQPTAAGRAKISIYQDFTAEGQVTSRAVSRYGEKISLDGSLYHIGHIPNSRQQYRLAMVKLDDILPLSSIENDQTDSQQEIAVLITAHGQDYDHIYLDCNQNHDFTDEQPLSLYNQQQNYQTIERADGQVNLALTSLDANGRQLHLSTDTLGHGTFLAGIIGANGAEYQGLAPQVQLAVYKIFDREGKSSQYSLAKAIEQAVADQVDLINLSLSIPSGEQRLPRLTAAIELAAQRQIPIIAAAGNYGPAADTLAYPASDRHVLSIGSYLEPGMLELDQAVTLEQPFIASYSSRGSVDGSREPFLVAPAAVISTVPSWYGESYLYDEGTSISAAIVSGATLHLLQREPQLQLSQLKNALRQWAMDLGFSVIEQGGGAFRLSRYTALTEISQVTEPQPQEIELLDTTNPRSIHFSIPQGQTQTWYMQLPAEKEKLAITITVDQQEPQNSKEHLIALGRCQAMLFNPQSQLAADTPYIGATFSKNPVTSAKLNAQQPEAGLWQLTVTSDQSLSRYNHFLTCGWLTIEAR